MHGVAISDEHIHPWRDCSLDGGHDRLADGLAVVDQSMQLAEERGCPWFHLGDLKLTRGIWHQDALSGLLELFRRHRALRKYMLPGNGGHDGMGTKETGEGGYDPFRECPNTVVIDTPTVAPANRWPGLTEPTAWWPWRPHHAAAELLPPFLAAARAAGARVLFAHAFFADARVGPMDIKIDQGYGLEDFGLAGPKAARVFDWAFVGDNHTQQCIGDPTRRNHAAVWLPGSPYAQNWGELQLDKGCLYFDTTRRDVEPVPLQAPRYRVVPMPTTDRELRRADVRPGDFVRVVVQQPLTDEQLEWLRQGWKPRVLRPEWAAPEQAARADGMERRSRATASMTREALLEEYLRAVPPPEGVDLKSLRVAGIKLLRG